MISLLIVIIFSTNLMAVDCQKHPIFCQILRNNPNLESEYAMELSNLIYKYGNKHQIPIEIYTAILMQESRYSIKAKNTQIGLRKLSIKEKNQILLECDVIDTCEIPNYKEVKIYTDFGISQVHYRTAQLFDLDIEKLTKDLDYSIEAGILILKDFQTRYAHKEPDWWTRYNASNKQKRNIYKQLVERYL